MDTYLSPVFSVCHLGRNDPGPKCMIRCTNKTVLLLAQYNIRFISSFSFTFPRADGQPSLKKGMDCTKLVDDSTNSESNEQWKYVWRSAECSEIESHKFFICNAYTIDDPGIIEPLCEKAGILRFRQRPTQTGLYCHIRWLDA